MAVTSRVLCLCLCVWLCCVGFTSVSAFSLSSYAAQNDAAEALKTALSSGDLVLDKPSGRVLVKEAMERGWWDVVGEIVDAGQSRGLDLSSTVYQSAAVIRRQLQALTESLGKSKVSTGIAPAFEWAQSPDSVLLNIKFAHKWDTPATLGCEVSGVNITARDLLFEANCKAKKKKFRLALDLNREVVSENSTWSIAAVGRAMVTLRKASNSTWPRLLKAKNKPGNMHIWWAMHERYEDANDKLEDEEKANIRKLKAEEKLKKDKAEKEGEGDNNNNNAGDTGSNSGDAPTPSPTPTPTPPSAFEVRREALQKEYNKSRKAAEAQHKTVVNNIDSNARKQKKAIDEQADKDKAAADDTAAKARKAAEEAHTMKLSKLSSELAAAIAAARSELGVKSEL